MARRAWTSLAIVATWLLAALLAALPARAQHEVRDPAPSTLLLVRTAGDERVVSRIMVELKASAWNVIEIGPAVPFERADLPQLASSHAAIAALRFDASNTTFDLWIARAEGAADGSLETVPAEDIDERVPALRITEALRARGLSGRQSLPSAPPEQAAEPEPEPERRSRPPTSAPEVASTSRPSEPAALLAFPRLWIEVAPAFAISAGGVGPEFGAWLDVRLQPAPIASLAIFALAPIWSEPLRAPEGSARVSTLLVGAGADVHWIRPGWEIALRAGAGGLFSFMHGDAHSGFRSSDETVIVATILAGPSLHLDLGAHFRVGARAIGGIALPRIAVRFAERDVAHWGRPFALATLGLERAF